MGEGLINEQTIGVSNHLSKFCQSVRLVEFNPRSLYKIVDNLIAQ